MSAAVWINGRSANIAMMDADGDISTCEIDRGIEPEQSYLAMVVRATGDAKRVPLPEHLTTAELNEIRHVVRSAFDDATLNPRPPRDWPACP